MHVVALLLSVVAGLGVWMAQPSDVLAAECTGGPTTLHPEGPPADPISGPVYNCVEFDPKVARPGSIVSLETVDPSEELPVGPCLSDPEGLGGITIAPMTTSQGMSIALYAAPPGGLLEMERRGFEPGTVAVVTSHRSVAFRIHATLLAAGEYRVGIGCGEGGVWLQPLLRIASAPPTDTDANGTSATTSRPVVAPLVIGIAAAAAFVLAAASRFNGRSPRQRRSGSAND